MLMEINLRRTNRFIINIFYKRLRENLNEVCTVTYGASLVVLITMGDWNMVQFVRMNGQI